jgi:succinoglycan biosynthesis transport protein ExoP
MEEDVKGIGDYLAIIKRRRWQFIVPALLIFVAATLAALLIPPTYRSSATILIEQQEIPQDLVRTTVTSYAAERVQVISYRVLTTAKLGEIIERYNLYPKERQQLTQGTVAQAMREEDIKLDMVSADVVDPRTGRPAQATIAFKLSYDHGTPAIAQKVTNELVSLFLNENLKQRRQAAQETAKFLAAEADRISADISSLEGRLAKFKEQHADSLPERMQINLQLMQNTEDKLRASEQSIRTLEERRIFLQSALAQMDPYAATGSGSQRVLSPAERLKQLELEYVAVAARYAADHPNRIRMEKEVAALRREVGSTDTTELKRRLVEQKAELATLKDRYSAEHPDVKKAQRAVAATEKQIAAGGNAAGPDTGAANADNPAYLQMRAQLQAAESELRAVQLGREQLQAQRADLEQRINEAPAIERDYRALVRDYDNATAKYKELKAKQMEAELAQSMEAESKGERFSLIEPPQQPEKPFKPNRLAIFFLGFVFAFGGGFGHVALRETMDTAVRGSRAVMSITGAPPLAVIPYIVTDQELAAGRRRKWLWTLAFVLLVAAGVAVLHFAFGPLDVLWFRVMNRLELILGRAS